jgi:hypothetical protein
VRWGFDASAANSKSLGSLTGLSFNSISIPSGLSVLRQVRLT